MRQTTRFRMGRAPSTGAVVALVLLLCACSPTNPSVTPTPELTHDPSALNVTALLDLSGTRSPGGSPQRDALQLWADQHSATVPRVKLKVVDVSGSPSKTALELRRAAVEDRADAIVVGVAVDYDDAFDNIVQLAHVPVLFTLPIREPATRDGGWAFALAPTPAQLSRVVLDDAARRSVLSSSLIVSDESTTAIIDRIAITTELGRRQVNPIVITVTAADATGKLRPLLASTSTVILAGTPRSYVDAARTVTPGTTLYLSYVSELAEIGDLRDAAALAVWPGSRWITASAAAVGGSTVARSSFVQAYSDRAGPPSTVAASAYDALALLASVAEKGTDSEQMRERLESSSFAGVAAAYTFRPSQHAGFNPGALVLLRYVAPRAPPEIR